MLFSSACAGLLDTVSELEWKSESLGQVIHLTWGAPPSLDITGVDLDIWYYVDVTTLPVSCPFGFAVDETIGSNHSMVVTIPEFNFTMGDYNDTSTSVIYEFRVTPINGAGAGITSAPITGYFSGRELLIIRWIVD